MAKTRSTKAGGSVREPEPYDARQIDLTTFKPDISLKDWTSIFKAGDLLTGPIFFPPIDTLSCTKTVGLGRTNLTLIMPTIVQIDAATPFASFNRQTTPSRNPVVQMHFQPSAYGITTVQNYSMAFTVDVSGQSTFNVSGFAGSGTLSGTGPRTLSGKQIVTLIFKNLPASQQVFGFLEQTAGAQWSWFTTRVSFPPLVIFI
jgi:hypothetical protein